MPAAADEYPIRTCDAVASTNDSIHDAGARGEPEGTTHIARVQTRGRGRKGRRWWSPPGAGLWMSTLLRPRTDRSRWAELALVAGVAVKTALERLGVRGVHLEWPNDLVVGRRKLGGILCEARDDGRGAWIALGIGLNLDLTTESARAAMPAELRGRITCMTAAGPPSTKDLEDIARAIFGELRPLYERFQRGERAGAIAAPHLLAEGRRVRVSLPDGGSLEGRCAGLGESGELLVERPDGGIAGVIAGDVEYEDR